MKKATQSNNFIKISTAFGYDSIILNSFQYYEGLSELFSLQALAYFNGTQGDLSQVIGKPAVILMDNNALVTEDPRYFHGVVTNARILGSRVTSGHEGENYKDIELTIRPRLALCEFRKNNRIFQNKDVKEIISLILGEHAVEFALKLNKTYPKYTFKVQYNESDLEFILRLLSEEGISFSFVHEESGHKLELFDDLSFYQPSTEAAISHSTGSSEFAHVSSWQETQSITTKASCLSGFDMLKPNSLPSHNVQMKPASYTPPMSEYYEYMGEEETGDKYAYKNQHILESLQRESQIFSGTASCRTFTTGQTFKFDAHEDKAFVGKEFVLTHVSVNASVFNQTGSHGNTGQGVEVQFYCMDVKKLFRPPLPKAKPRIQGIQTAIVTGPSEGDIHVDKHGRIKVQFHWDREGKRDAQSSCWIRVAQQSAGNGWGSSFLPRVGQEVIVEFVNGDPDQPIVMGVLYNGANATPYALPDKKTQSGIKSRSVKGGASNFNEVRFEDKPGKELLYLHAEKDYQSVVENNADILVENDKVQTVTNNEAHNVGKNLSVDVGEILSLTAGKSIELKVGGASITMSSSGEINIKGNQVAINGSAIDLKAGKIALN
ncbi:putative VgrG protein [Vibrio nigripulchritudo MADA3029]|uniref:type VI secretion system tip protein TssI/VgrG n=1 Tax=Vibrio nigripulchritudo TaxID=28173 RepID=UPI0003B20A01|nr:type VI secretion system tip protein TssI/VgrG [Vibrio nigripulchritudo]CCN45733.1 putative VgrG protein [Vibrio nigripulchritudo MADA3020]CCN52925.1 putative VgrG protein [Vibrio nigripulchritudo MADA3021]CCN61640.1 putative VgrG protein [Vibrio nigripulchritudo MADA3029]